MYYKDSPNPTDKELGVKFSTKTVLHDGGEFDQDLRAILHGDKAVAVIALDYGDVSSGVRGKITTNVRSKPDKLLLEGLFPPCSTSDIGINFDSLLFVCLVGLSFR